MYDAWGNLISSTGTTENSYLYCGEQLDSTTGLYYLRARYMNPTTGTFISIDTYQGSIFEPVTLHKYLYANANPVMYSDPSGYMSEENSLDFYQQAWLTIPEATQYIAELVCSSSNPVSHDEKSVKIGHEIIKQLRNTGLEYAITSLLEPYVGPDVARLIANGIVTALDIAKSSRNKNISNNNGIVNGSNNDTDVVYRGLRSDENPMDGLSAKNPNRGMSVEGHVSSGSRNKGSQYISTTKDVDIARRYAGEGGVVVSIRLDALGGDVKIYDLTNKDVLDKHIKFPMTRNFATKSKEVLIEGYIPPDAITII